MSNIIVFNPNSSDLVDRRSRQDKIRDLALSSIAIVSEMGCGTAGEAGTALYLEKRHGGKILTEQGVKDVKDTLNRAGLDFGGSPRRMIQGH